MIKQLEDRFPINMPEKLKMKLSLDKYFFGNCFWEKIINKGKESYTRVDPTKVIINYNQESKKITFKIRKEK